MPDRESPRLQVGVRGSIHVELFGPGGMVALMLLHLITDQRRLGVVNEAQALVALADSLL